MVSKPGQTNLLTDFTEVLDFLLIRLGDQWTVLLIIGFLNQLGFQGLLYPKMKMLALITDPHFVPNP